MKPVAGRVWKFGDNISADDGIILYSQVPDLGSFDIPALKAMCFTRLDPEFPKKVAAGDIIVAGSNFGHHSHPHACVAMLQSGIAACLCESTDSAFIRKALNYGLPIVVCRGIGSIVDTGDIVSIDLVVGTATNPRTGTFLEFRPFCKEMLDVFERGGLEEALRARVAQLA
jgi:3-isopropylmalate/(R)-2-methylmalate dehydratase small subunit